MTEAIVQGTSHRLNGHPLRQVIKRNGQFEQLKYQKITSAIRRCFVNSLGKTDAEGISIAEVIASSVVNIIAQKQEPISVEEVQRLVIQQLWANNFHEAAEQYTLWKEKHKKERVEHPINPEDEAAVLEDARHFPTPLQYFQFVSKYARWNDSKGRRETWRECCDRVMNFFRTRPQLKDKVREEEWQELDQSFFELQALPALRIVQMAGPALERCNVGGYNCSFSCVDSLEAFDESLYILMQGTGYGFSVESEFINKLPKVKKQKKSSPLHHVIEDSTEGWCKAYRLGLEHWWNGLDVNFDYSLIRPQGARLKTKGGKASGPEPLKHLFSFVRNRILSRQGSFITPRIAHDMMCMTGKIVQVGGVRRASLISFSDLDDLEMRNAKNGNWWDSSNWLDMANNSGVYEEKPSATDFMEEWLSLAKSGSGERGIFNFHGVTKNIPKRRKRVYLRGNPCLEILLRNKQFCNLSIVPARRQDDVTSLEKKVRWAAIFGTMQATMTDFRYLRDEWRVHSEEERLIGVDITGQMDCPFLRPGSNGREELLVHLRNIVGRTNEEWSSRLGINRSAADTCGKPSGNSSVLLDCSAGIHARHAPYYLRRVRCSVFDPVAILMKDEGVPWHVDPMNSSLIVFDFPIKAPEGCVTRNDMSALEQLENWLVWKRNWAEHTISCTVSVDDDEWFRVGNWVYDHWDDVTGLSFLPRDGGTYQLAPYQEIDKDTYERLVKSFPSINWSKLRRYEQEDMTTSAQEYACVGGQCDL